jgi:hypothetical protein
MYSATTADRMRDYFPGKLSLLLGLALANSACDSPAAPVPRTVILNMLSVGRHSAVDMRLTVNGKPIAIDWTSPGRGTAIVQPPNLPSIDVALQGDSSTSHFSAVFSIPTAMTRATLPMIPTTWMVQGGRYDGWYVRVDLAAAFRRPCSQPQNPNCNSFYPAEWLTQQYLWPGFGHVIAFDHALSTDAITPGDSTALGASMEELLQAAGRQHFKYGPRGATHADSVSRNTILVRLDHRIEPYVGLTSWWGSGGFIWAGLIRVSGRPAVRNGPVMIHELLHALGYMHTCAWPSIMGGYGCPIQHSPTRDDVAYMQLAEAYKSVDGPSSLNGWAGALAPLRPFD